MDPKQSIRTPFARCFYYSEKAAERPSSTAARLDMEAFATEVDSQSLWANTFAASQEKKKLIVITDWRLAHLSVMELQAYQLWINSLLLHGFSVYVLQEERIEPFSSTHLQLAQLKKIQYLPPAKVYKIVTATLPHSSADETLLFDFDAQKRLAEHSGFPVERLPGEEDITPFDMMNPSIRLSKEFIENLPEAIRKQDIDLLTMSYDDSQRGNNQLFRSMWLVRHPNSNGYGQPSIKIFLYGIYSEDESSTSYKVIQQLLSTAGKEGYEVHHPISLLLLLSLLDKNEFSIPPVLAQYEKTYCYVIERWKINSFAWIEHISNPTQLSLINCTISPESLASCEGLSNPYITRLVIEVLDELPAGFLKAILRAMPQLQFLTINGLNEENLQECLEHLPAGCQLNIKLFLGNQRDFPCIPSHQGKFHIEIKYDSDAFKEESPFNFDLSGERTSHNPREESHSKEEGIQKVSVVYSNRSCASPISLRNAVDAYHIQLEEVSILDEALYYPHLEVLELERVSISKELLIHIIRHAPRLKTVILKYKGDFGENGLGIEVVTALYNAPNFKTLRYNPNTFTSSANSFLERQEKFSCFDLRTYFEKYASHPIVPSKPKPGIVYNDGSDNVVQLSTDGKIALQKQSVCNQQPYFISFPESREEKQLRQGLFYFDKQDHDFKNVKFKQTYQIVADIKVQTGPLDYQQGMYLENKDQYKYEHYNPGLTLNCRAGIPVPLYTTSPQDVLVALAIRSSQGKAVSVKVEKGAIDGLYYLTTKEDIQISCEFVMATPPEKLLPVPKPLQGLADTIQNFDISTEDLPDGLSSNEARLEALWQKKAGACRHRTQVLLHQASKCEELSTVQLYMASGSNHAWPEWRSDDMVMTQNFDCLGGYPSVEIYHDSEEFNRERLLAKKETAALVRRPLNFFKKQEEAQSAIKTISEKKMNKLQPKKADGTGFAERCLSLSRGRNYLTIFDHKDEANTFIDTLLAKAPHRVHSVHHRKRLHTVGKGIIQTEQGWIRSETAQGELNHFFQLLPEGEAPVIILDLPPGDLVQYNSLYDPDCRKRKINGVDIPEDAIIIILAENNSVIFEDNSILSRLHETVYLAAQNPEQKTSKETVAVSAEYTFSLYGSNDWKALLLGYCMYNHQGQADIFKGYLLESIAKGYPIKILHPPRNNSDFDVFIRDLNAKKGFWFLGKWYDCPQGVVVDSNSAYDFSVLHETMQVLPDNTPLQMQKTHHHLVNSHTFERCLRNLVIVNKTPCEYPGWIENAAAAGEALNLYITDNLSTGQWYCLLETCAKYNVKLAVQCAAGVKLPNELGKHYSPLVSEPRIDTTECLELEQLLWGSQIGGTLLYSENHLHSYYQCQALLNNHGHNPYLLIDASELSDESALYSNQIYRENGEIKGHCAISDILKVLQEENGIVVLTGDLQPSLLAHLSTLFLNEPYLWVNGEKREIKGRLIVIPEKGQPLNEWLASDRKWNHPVSPKPVVVPPLTPVLPIKVSDKTWWLEEEFKAVLRARENFVLEQLERKPFVFLQGPAGSGKSSLALQLKQHLNIPMYYEDDIASWAKPAQDGKIKILFIDEANLRTQQQWTLFQGLFNDPPGIYYNQKFYPLTKEHKVIFAGNPLDHGGKRIVPTLFQRYPECTIHCPPLPAAYIEHAVLRDIFRYIPGLSEDRELLAAECHTFLKDYVHETGDIRSLQSKAMLQCYERTPQLSNTEKEEEKIAHDYVLLQSRRPCQQVIINSLKIQQFKRWAHARAGNNGNLLDAACYGGYSGVLIEGAPDTGKTELIKATLIEQGYSQATLGSAPHAKDAKVYYIMDAQNIDAILDEAFQEGAVLLWDEINSYLTPALTAKLNSYLSGYNLEKKAPKQAGFTLLSSINPASMQGRVAMDTALCSRLQQQHLKKYQDHEVGEILEKIAADLPVPMQEAIAREFFEKRQAAIDMHRPKPGPRYLQQMVKEARAKSREQEIDIAMLRAKNHSRYFVQPPHAQSKIRSTFTTLHS